MGVDIHHLLSGGSTLLGASFLVIFSASAFNRIQTRQGSPYLDEVFHVPQTQKFCNGTFNEWDPKITTLPGTYLLAAGILKLVDLLNLITGDICSTRNLRLFNLIVGFQNFHLLKGILKSRMGGGENDWKIVLSALNIALFPVLHFFSYLYYTDVTSTFWLLGMHSLFLKGRHWSASLCGLLSVLTRQTNVVWVAWHGMLVGLNSLNMAWKEVVNIQKSRKDQGKISGSQTRKKKAVQEDKEPQNDGSNSSMYKLLLRKIFARILTDLPDLLGYALCISLFILFVLWNRGIVVGDKSAHQVSFNFPQMGYFTLVYGLFCSPFIVMRLKSVFRFMCRHKLVVVFGGALFVLIVRFNTVAHPYLLADNRHYTFYIWKRIYQANEWMRYAVIPGYIFVWSFLFYTVYSGLGFNYSLALFICTFVQLVPQLLMEFRYFIPVYIFARVGIPGPTWKELMMEFILNVAINIITFYLFLYRPFYWPNSEDKQRFMW